MVLNYKGVVTIKKPTSSNSWKEIKIENNGTDNLFWFFMRSIVGDYDESLLPKCIDIRYDRNGILQTLTTSSGSPIVSTSLIQSDEGKWVALFVAHISRNDINKVRVESMITNKQDKGIVLVMTDADRSRVLASVPLPLTDLSSIIELEVGQKAVVEWSMTIDNVVE